MLKCLVEIRGLLTSYIEPSGLPASTPTSTSVSQSKAYERRKELLEALFSELLEKTGDREKEAAVRWWYQNRDLLVRGLGESDDGKGGSYGWLGWRSKPIGTSKKDNTSKKGDDAVVNEAPSTSERRQANVDIISRL